MPLMNLKLFKRRELWAVGVYRFANLDEIFDPSRGEMIKLVRESGLRKSHSYKSTVADPFLFVAHDRIYLFYEVKTDHSHGEIWAQSMAPDGAWVDHGCVLKEDFHLSYPQVFCYDGRIFMIPEAAQSGQVILYEAHDFPNGWKRHSILVDEPLRDPTIVFDGDNEVFLIASSGSYDLKLFHSSDLFSGFQFAGIFIENDPSVARCGGGFIRIGEDLIRPAQDCSIAYGKQIDLRLVKQMSRTSYVEETSRLQLNYRETWMSEGSHHISSVSYEGGIYVALDGRAKDSLLNSLMLGVLKLFDWFKAFARRAMPAPSPSQLPSPSKSG